MEKGKRKVRNEGKKELRFFKDFYYSSPKRTSDFETKILPKILSSVVQDFHGVFNPREVELQLSKFEAHVGRAGSGLSDDLPKLL